MKKLLLVLLFAVPAFAQNVRFDTAFPSITSQGTTPFLVANIPPLAPLLSVCHSPANAVPCTNYATTYTGAGVACPNGAQDTPAPNALTSACQSNGDTQGNIGFWVPAGQYDYTVCIGFNCFGPYTVTPGPSLSSNNTFTGTNTFTGATNLNAGGNIAGSWTGNPTFLGNPLFSGSASFTGGATFSSVSPTFNVAANLNTGGNIAGTWTGSPVLTGDPATCELNNTFYVGAACNTFWGTSDIGGQINAAYAAGPSNGVHIHIMPAIYSYSTGIMITTIGRPVFLECASGVAGSSSGNVPSVTQLVFTPTSGNAILIDTGTGNKVIGCSFTGSGGTSVGMFLGGPTISNSFILGVIDKVDIGGFGVGLEFGWNVYISSFLNLSLHDNTTNNLLISNSGGEGENIVFQGGSISNKLSAFSTTCASILFGGDYHFRDISFDQCGITASAVNAFIDFQSVHVENPNGATASPFFTFGTACNFCSLTVTGGEWIEDGTTGVRTEFIKDTSTVANHDVDVTVNSGSFIPNETVAQLFNATGAACCARATIPNFVNGFGGSQFTNPTGGNILGVQAMFQVGDCGTTSSCAGTFLSGPLKLKMIKGSAPLVSGTPSVVTVTAFNPAFTSSSSFVCTVSNATTAANSLKVVNVSGTSITITGPNTVTDTVNYICVGT
jgi:hypothetical protein